MEPLPDTPFTYILKVFDAGRADCETSELLGFVVHAEN
jgi:hypothetical protein